MFRVSKTGYWFDRSIIRSNWSRMNQRPLGRAGGLVRKIARNSIRRRSANKVSPPGSPPYSHQKGATPPFKMIYNVPYNRGSSEIVGMVGFGDAIPAPGIHEHGLTKTVKSIQMIPGKFRRRLTKKGWRMRPAYKRTKTVVNYDERPFMFPAMVRAAPQLPPLWRGSLHGR